jgi:hypothetical protein
LGIERTCKRYGDVSVLLQDTPEIYYWIGFLFADGNFKNNKLVRMSIKEKDHLDKFAKLLNIETRKNIYKANNTKFPNGTIRSKDCVMWACSLQDIQTIPLITSKFDISPQKTYNPPKVEIFEKMSDDLFLSLFCGYVDGDGCVSKTNSNKECYAIHIRCHSSWLQIYEYFEQRINSIFNRKLYLGQKLTTIIKPNYASLKIADNHLCGQIKKRVQELNLPLMERKWCKINTDYKGAHQVAAGLREKVIPLWKQGLRKIDIAAKLSLPWYTVRNTIKLYEKGALNG